MNIVILDGRLSTEPRRSELPDGTVAWSLDLSTDTARGAVSVPVVHLSDSLPDTWCAGARLVVVGIGRHRFFRAAGSTQSRTEVVAARIVEITARRSAATALASALRALGRDEGAALRSAVTAAHGR